MRKQCLNVVLSTTVAACSGTGPVFDTPADGESSGSDGAADGNDDAADDPGTPDSDGSEGVDPDGTDPDDGGTDGDDRGDTGSDDAGSAGTDGDGTSEDDAGDATDSGTDDSGDATDSGTDDSGTDDSGTDEDPPDFRVPGPFSLTTRDQSHDLGNGCTMNSTLYEPEDPATDVTVVLVHGFMGARASMAGWAQHFGSWGIPVVAPDLCHATVIDADHEQNGRDLALLVEALELDSVVFAGFSAGGLAAVLAASQVEGTQGLLGLDMVDSGGLGMGVAASIDAAAVDLVGEPSSCNDTGNGVAVFQAMPEHRVVRLTDSIHCDFQNPGDGLCSLTCAGSTSPDFSAQDIQTAILGLSTAYLAGRTGAEDSGPQWWQPGHFYWDEITQSGLLTEL